MIKFLSCIEGFYAPKSYTIGQSFLNGYLDGQCVQVRCKESRSNLPETVTHIQVQKFLMRRIS